MQLPRGDRLRAASEIVVELDGEWDIAGRHALTERLGQAVADVGLGDLLILDLRDVTFIDSAVLGCFVELQRVVATRRGRLLTLCRHGSLVDRTIKATRLDEALNLAHG